MKFLKTALVVCFLLILAVFGLKNADIVTEAVKTQVKGVSEMNKVPGAVSKALVSDETFMRNQLVDLSGLYYRFTARQAMNDIVKLNNGMLTDEHVAAKDMTQYAAQTKEFSDWLAERGIDFLYVQFPYKMDIGKELLPMGYENESPDNALELTDKLQDAAVNTLDLYAKMGATVKQIEDNFYVTDHHWKPTGAFRAFQATAAKLQEMYPGLPILGQPMLEEKQWTVHTAQDQFLGSRGKRVGQLYAGVDDLEWLTPKFETSMSTFVPKYSELRTGTFEDAMIVRRYIDDPASLHALNHYCVYIGGDYPLVHHRNANAPVDKKVMIIKDSFSLPYQAFMATLFTEVDVLDPRYYDLNSIPEYIQLSQPDVVLLSINPSVFIQARYFTYEYPETTPANAEVVYSNSFTMNPTDKTHHYRVISKDMERGATYRLTVGSIDVIEGETEGVTLRLYDFDKSKNYDAYCFDLQYGPEEETYQWTFRVPESEEHNLQLLIYAGLSGKTNMIGLDCEDVVLEKLY